jgi:hypothetical protein
LDDGNGNDNDSAINSPSHLGNGDFTRYEDVDWSNRKGEIRCYLDKRRKSKMIHDNDTLVSLKVPDTPSRNNKNPDSKKRNKAKVIQELEQEQEDEIEAMQKHHQSETDRLKQQLLQGEASGTQFLQIKAMQKEKVEKLSARGEEHAAAESEWRSERKWLRRELRESRNRLVLALQQESQSQ